ncbi:MAG: hypothetical protein ACRC8S_14750 [Fimbriiglobus sp.]
MAKEKITRQQIEQYLHDALPVTEATKIEKAIRDEPALLALVNQVRRESDVGEHSVGAIWRRARLSCPSREHLGMFLEEILDDDHREYIQGHLQLVACHMCRAMLDDLQCLAAEPKAKQVARKKRIVDSSAGILTSTNARK